MMVTASLMYYNNTQHISFPAVSTVAYLRFQKGRQSVPLPSLPYLPLHPRPLRSLPLPSLRLEVGPLKSS